MQTIRLRINDNIYDKLIWLLSNFNKDQLEIISENKEYNENQIYLNKELNEIKEGKANFINIQEVEQRLELIIDKNENTI